MRKLILSALSGCLLLTGGCATNRVVEWKAKPHVEWDKATNQNVDVAGKPGYYALLPLTVPFDVVTFPIQFAILLAWPAAKVPPLRSPGGK